MTFQDIIKKTVLENFDMGGISTTKILITLMISFAVAFYIYLIYRLITKKQFFDKNYGVTLATMSVITAGIILAMQSNLVISLGMVGALSIVRFRTAIKDPLDLLFLFWSIGTGIICGAGLYQLVIVVAFVTTISIFVLEYLPVKKDTYLLVINTSKECNEEEVEQVIIKGCTSYKLRSKNINSKGIDMIYEVKTKDKREIVDKLDQVMGVMEISIIICEANANG